MAMFNIIYIASRWNILCDLMIDTLKEHNRTSSDAGKNASDTVVCFLQKMREDFCFILCIYKFHLDFYEHI